MLSLSHVLFTNSCNRLNSFHCHSTVKGILEMPSHTSSWTLHQSSYSINYIHICSLLLHLVSYPVSTSSVAHNPSSNFHHFSRALQYLHLQTSCTSGAVCPMSTLHCNNRLKSLSQDCISHTRSSTSARFILHLTPRPVSTVPYIKRVKFHRRERCIYSSSLTVCNNVCRLHP